MSAYIESLDIGAAAAVAEFEHAFYAGFVDLTENRLIRRLWRWDHPGRRLATRIPYRDQVVFVERGVGGEIETAMAINVSMRECQAAAFGFAPATDTTGSCELLTFFTLDGFQLWRKLRFWKECLAELRRRDMHTAYATTAPHPLRSYMRIGGELMAEREVEGEMRYFLKFATDRYWMRR